MLHRAGRRVSKIVSHLHSSGSSTQSQAILSSKCAMSESAPASSSVEERTKDWKERLATTNAKMTTQDIENLYNSWGPSYDDCLAEWGYRVPAIMNDLLRSHCREYGSAQIKVFDLGCGTGLVGREIKQNAKDAIVVGSDLSEGQFPMAAEKGYDELQQWDMNEFPFPFDDDAFDALSCAGTLTYAENKVRLFEEWVRITKPNSIIICSHRSDFMERDLKYFEEMEQKGLWEKVEHTDSVPYLPGNENYGDRIQVQFYVARNTKKQLQQ